MRRLLREIESRTITRAILDPAKYHEGETLRQWEPDNKDHFETPWEPDKDLVSGTATGHIGRQIGMY